MLSRTYILQYCSYNITINQTLLSINQSIHSIYFARNVQNIVNIQPPLGWIDCKKNIYETVLLKASYSSSIHNALKQHFTIDNVLHDICLWYRRGIRNFGISSLFQQEIFDRGLSMSTRLNKKKHSKHLTLTISFYWEAYETNFV